MREIAKLSINLIINRSKLTEGSYDYFFFRFKSSMKKFKRIERVTIS